MAERQLTAAAGWAALAAAAGFFFLPVMNPDIFWHLSAGKYAAAHLAVPRADWLSWTAAGTEWVDFEWGAQVIYYLLHKAGGFWALFLLKAGLLTALLLVARRLCLLNEREDLAPAALPLLAAALVSSSDLRPENFTLLFFTVELYFLEKLRLGRAAGRRLPAAAFVFFAVWINLHAGCFYGLALAGLYAAGAFAAERLPVVYGRPAAKTGLSGACAGLFAAGLAASLCNPYGWKVYAVGFAHAGQAGELARYIQEWGAFSFSNRYQWPFVLLLAASAAAQSRAALRGRAVFQHLFCFVFFAWAAAGHARHIPFFALTAVAGLLAQASDLPALRPPARRLAWALWLGCCVWFWGALVLPNYSRAPSGFKSASPGLERFLKAESAALAPLRLYNYWGWGGWLGWRLGPDYKVFVDGRYLFHSYLPEMVEARASARGWQELIARYRFGLMLINLDEPPAPVRQRLSGGGTGVLWRPAYLFYLPKRDWAVVYWDAKVGAVVRRAAVPAAWLAGREYRWLRPGDMHNLRQPVLNGDVRLGELEADARLYSGAHPGDRSAEDFVAGLKAACGQKGAKCRK